MDQCTFQSFLTSLLQFFLIKWTFLISFKICRLIPNIVHWCLRILLLCIHVCLGSLLWVAARFLHQRLFRDLSSLEKAMENLSLRQNQKEMQKRPWASTDRICPFDFWLTPQRLIRIVNFFLLMFAHLASMVSLQRCQKNFADLRTRLQDPPLKICFWPTKLVVHQDGNISWQW